MIKQGADVDAIDDITGSTPLHYTMNSGKIE